MNEASLKELGLWPLWQKKDVAQATPPANPAQPDNRDHLRQGAHDRGYLPHLKAQGGAYFVTFRLADSLPQQILEALRQLPPEAQTARVDEYLDAAHGACSLRDERVAGALRNILSKYDGERYRLHAWAIMPNHVHLVIEPLHDFTLSDVLQGIKSASAHEANRLLDRQGEFWQRESYDHLVRDDDDMARCCRYVQDNPVRAGLSASAEAYRFGSAFEQPSRLLAGGVACATSTRSEEISRMDWQALQRSVAGCVACQLAKTRTQTVFGVGAPGSDWLFVGEAPGAEEDARGEPFVGQAGKLLDNMLSAIGLKRGRNVCIANVVKCRPPGNRNPETEEMEACAPYLARQIELIRPKLIVALGRVAAQRLLASDDTIARLRGGLHDYRGTPLIVTYHPAYLLRNLPDKAKAWQDLCLALKTMQDMQSTETPDHKEP